MKKILSNNEISTLVIDLHEADDRATTQHAGAIEIHCGNHPRLGLISIVTEHSTGQGFVVVEKTLARPVLSIAA